MRARKTKSRDGFRRLAGCPECLLQYDVTRLALGSRLRCSCGRLLTPIFFQPRPAAAVRCSACGWPRQGAAARCHFCGVDFSRHERDRNTICPDCRALLSDRARYCHCCGLAILPQTVSGYETRVQCPACSRRPPLTRRKQENLAVEWLECRCCGGVLLERDEFSRLLETALSQEIWLTPKFRITAQAPPSAPAYRRCPICERQMIRRNLMRSGGVAVDVCRDGMWLDSDEADVVLGWISAGNLAENQESRRPSQLLQLHHCLY